jgi:hypothetical protein
MLAQGGTKLLIFTVQKTVERYTFYVNNFRILNHICTKKFVLSYIQVKEGTKLYNTLSKF